MANEDEGTTVPTTPIPYPRLGVYSQILHINQKPSEDGPPYVHTVSNVVERRYTTVGELVEQLQKLDQSLPVATDAGDWGYTFRVWPEVGKLERGNRVFGIEKGASFVFLREPW